MNNARKQPVRFLKLIVFALIGSFWAAIHTSSVYYVNFDYGTYIGIFLGAAAMSMLAPWIGTTRKSFYRLARACPIILGTRRVGRRSFRLG